MRSLPDAYYGIGASKLLGAERDIDGKALCTLAESELAKPWLDLQLCYFAAHVLKHARCAGPSRDHMHARACMVTYAAQLQIECMPDVADAAVLKAEQLQKDWRSR